MQMWKRKEALMSFAVRSLCNLYVVPIVQNSKWFFIDTHERGKETVLLSSGIFRNNAFAATLKNKPVNQSKRRKEDRSLTC